MQEKTLNLDLEGLKKFCKDVSINLNKGDIICLSGDLGSGKTTFSRYIINSIYKNQNKEPPNIIKSPSFPILLTYELSNFEIYHYDLYRVSKSSELFDLSPRGIREHLKLTNAIYVPTSAYGHFGREPTDQGHFTWEKTDLVDSLKNLL